MVLVKCSLASGQDSLMRPICTESCILVLKQLVLIARVVFISSGLYNKTLLYILDCWEKDKARTRTGREGNARGYEKIWGMLK